MRSLAAALRPMTPVAAVTSMPPSQFLYNAGRLEEALASYDRAVEIQPDNAAAPQNRVATKQREKLAAREA